MIAPQTDPASLHAFVRTVWPDAAPRVGLVLGSGLGFFADRHLDNAQALAYADIPGFPVSTVAGHAGKLVLGDVAGVSVLCLQGRFHYYEGYTMAAVTLPIRLMALLGVKTLLLTNAAGGIRADLSPGSLMVLTDHLNFLGVNPLRGPNEDDLGPRFPDMSVPYDADVRAAAYASAEAQGIDLYEGVYLATSGPSYETPAEIRAFRTLGADAVGMSTVPECVVARHAGLRVGAISCITNFAAGLGQESLSHEEVSATAATVQEDFARLLEGWIGRVV